MASDEAAVERTRHKQYSQGQTLAFKKNCSRPYKLSPNRLEAEEKASDKDLSRVLPVVVHLNYVCYKPRGV